MTQTCHNCLFFVSEVQFLTCLQVPATSYIVITIYSTVTLD